MNKDIFRNIILAGLFAIPFIPFLVWSELFFPYITSKAFAWRIIVEIIFASWVILALLQSEFRLKKSIILYCLWVFLLIIGIADMLGEAPLKSFWSNAERMEGYISLLHLGAFFAVIASVFSETEWRRWWNTTIAASLAMALVALGEALQGIDRVDATFGNPTYLAVYMLFHIFIAGFFMWRNRGESSRWMYGAVIVADALALYYTATRGAILGLLGGLLVMAVLNIRNRESNAMRKASIAVLVAVILSVSGVWFSRNTGFVQNSPVLARFTTITTEELKSGGRAFIWPMAIEGAKEKPLLGWGQENFNLVFAKHYDPDMYNLEAWFDRAHNIFLDWLIAGGILGLLSYLSLYAGSVYMIWKKDYALSRAEKSILTGLVVAYFLHNLFVFDHLVSYILFFSLLAYLHFRNAGAVIFPQSISESKIKHIALPAVAVVLVAVLYFGNLKPMSANSALIDAFKFMQLNEPQNAVKSFEKAYRTSRLGRPEVVEQVSINSLKVLESNLTIDEKNNFFRFVRTALDRQIEEFPNDPRYYIVSGAFLSRTGQFEDAESALRMASELMPSKQAIYFERGILLINQDRYPEAIAEFKKAYNLAPDNPDSRNLYLVAAIYGGDRALENQMLGQISSFQLTDDRISGAYKDVGREGEVIRILSQRLAKAPADSNAYIYLATMYVRNGQKAEAIEVLNNLAENIPAEKDQAERLIKELESRR